MIGKKRFIIAITLALIFDIFDYTLGWIPGIGDILDIVSSLMIIALVGPVGIIAFAELIPGVDVLPTYTATVILAKLIDKQSQSKGEGDKTIWL